MSAEASVSYAALILADAQVEISADNLLAVTKAAGASVDNVWAEIFARGLEGRDLKDLLFNMAAAAPAGAAPAAAGGAAPEAAAEEAKEEEKEESDDDMGFGLFD